MDEPAPSIPLLSRRQRKLLTGFAGFCLVVPNGIFWFGMLAHPMQVLLALVHNPVSLAAMISLAALTAGLAWFLHDRDFARPGWIIFLVLTALGGLAFAIFAFLLLDDARRAREREESQEAEARRRRRGGR